MNEKTISYFGGRAFDTLLDTPENEPIDEIRGPVIHAGTMNILSGLTSNGEFDTVPGGCRRDWSFSATQAPSFQRRESQGPPSANLYKPNDVASQFVVEDPDYDVRKST
jgi:hypothetical protein